MTPQYLAKGGHIFEPHWRASIQVHPDLEISGKLASFTECGWFQEASTERMYYHWGKTVGIWLPPAALGCTWSRLDGRTGWRLVQGVRGCHAGAMRSVGHGAPEAAPRGPTDSTKRVERRALS